MKNFLNVEQLLLYLPIFFSTEHMIVEDEKSNENENMDKYLKSINPDDSPKKNCIFIFGDSEVGKTMFSQLICSPMRWVWAGQQPKRNNVWQGGGAYGK